MLNVLVYGRALKYLPVSLAYPMLVGCTVAVVSVIALWRFGENLNFWHLVGFTCILGGIGILCWQAPVKTGIVAAEERAN